VSNDARHSHFHLFHRPARTLWLRSLLLLSSEEAAERGMSSSFECMEVDATPLGDEEPVKTSNKLALISTIQHAPPWTFAAALLGLLSIMTMVAYLLEPPGYHIRVAFSGNSMMYVNVSYIVMKMSVCNCMTFCFYG